MAIVYSENVVEIAVVANYGGAECVNVWHMFVVPNTSTDSIESVVADFRDNWQDDVMDIVTSQYVIDRFEWRSLDPTDNSSGVVDPDTAKPLQGAVNAEGAPNNTAYLLQKRTPNRPRGRRDGRCYLPGVPEAQIGTGGALESAQLSAAQTAITAFYNGISDTGAFNWEERYPVVLETTAASRAPGTTPVTIGSRRVTSLVVDPKVATQRGRMR